MHKLHRMGMELSCKFGRSLWVNPLLSELIKGVGIADTPNHAQEDCMHSDFIASALFAQSE